MAVDVDVGERLGGSGDVLDLVGAERGKRAGGVRVRVRVRVVREEEEQEKTYEKLFSGKSCESSDGGRDLRLLMSRMPCLLTMVLMVL